MAHPIRPRPLRRTEDGVFSLDAAADSALSSPPSNTASATHPGGRKRGAVTFEQSPPPSRSVAQSRKARKVSRACDFCKSRKAKCSGDRPCVKCISKGQVCLYDAKYTRGRPPTPPPSDAHPRPEDQLNASYDPEDISQISADIYPTLPGPETTSQEPTLQGSTGPSRASPELGMAEIQGQVFDPTSHVTFLHRALKRLSAHNTNTVTGDASSSAEAQPFTMAGDKPLPQTDTGVPIPLPDPEESRRLLTFYFDVCIATYRILHRPTVETWLSLMEKNQREKQPLWHKLGLVKVAIVLVALAIATNHDEKSKGFPSTDHEAQALRTSDKLFSMSTRLADDETGYPKLESVQVRILHVLYLLSTSRFNRSWYVFGTALQLIAALGLHRRANSKRRIGSQADYINTQCCIRTFWTAYIVDNYLAVIFGRPRHFHDQDIDQCFPDRVNDEEMTASGPQDMADDPKDCHIDALVFHAKISQIIGQISREVYTVRDMTSQERVHAVQKLNKRIRDWHDSLPLHLGSIRPSMLITSYRRQATVLNLAHSHAIMHANRLFLLGDSTSAYENEIDECMVAAKAVLNTVDSMAREGPIFHAFWWTHHVAFCALIVVFVWEIQQRRTGSLIGKQDRGKLLQLAEKCQSHLARATASNSPSRKYAVILEEFRNAATNQPLNLGPNDIDDHQLGDQQPIARAQGVEEKERIELNGTFEGDPVPACSDAQASMIYDPRLFDEWQTTDWLDLDSSAFWPDADLDEVMAWPTMV